MLGGTLRIVLPESVLLKIAQPQTMQIEIMDALHSELFNIGVFGLGAAVWILGVMCNNGLVAASGLGLIAFKTYLQLDR